MKAYSLDLRQKIIHAYTNQEGSIRQVARRFKVAKSFVQKLLKRYREEGTLAPKPQRDGFAAKLAEHLHVVEQLVEQENDTSLAELCEHLDYALESVCLRAPCVGSCNSFIKNRCNFCVTSFLAIFLVITRQV